MTLNGSLSLSIRTIGLLVPLANIWNELHMVNIASENSKVILLKVKFTLPWFIFWLTLK